MKLKWLIIILLLIGVIIVLVLNFSWIRTMLPGAGTEITTTGNQSEVIAPDILTNEEKGKLGLDENLKVEAVRRDEKGNVLIFKVGRSGLPPDSDADGLADEKETQLSTDPKKQDTDNDGVPDGQEVEMNFNPLDPKSPPQTKK